MVKRHIGVNMPIGSVTRKNWASGAALLLFVWLSLPTSALSLPASRGDESKGRREESQFDIYVDGKEIGYEKFSILASSSGIESRSFLSFRDPGKTGKKVQIETELSTDGKWMPRAYRLNSDVEGQKGTITGSFAPGEATFEYTGSGRPLRRGLPVGDRYIILDTNVFHHFVFLARLYDLRAGGTKQIEAVVPQELDGGKLKVSEAGVEMVPIHGKEMTLHRINADTGMLLIHLWVDDNQVLYKIALPAKKIEVIRKR